MFQRSFLFGNGAVGTSQTTVVHAADLYRPETGYGFVTEQNRREQEPLQISELNSGFDTVYWYHDRNLTEIREDAGGCYVDSAAAVAALEEQAGERQPGEPRRLPMIFKADVPRPGNYRVTLTVRADEPMRDVLIYNGRRRLSFRGDIPAGIFTYDMIVNVCDIVPRGQTRVYNDRSVDITMIADRPLISGLKVAEVSVPTIYIAGDSTVTDQSAEYPYAPGTSYSGWGQMITAYLNTRVAVSNHAHSGLTTDSFRKEGHYAIVEFSMRQRDFLFLQFGHNDQKLEALKASGGYQSNLMRYITECREKGAFPVLVTPLARNTWKGNDGTYNDLLAEYAAACFEAGRIAEVPVIDLHGLSMRFVTEHGLEGAKPYYFPGDYTHTNDYGAYLMAGYVAAEIRRVCGSARERAYRFLADCVTDGFGTWESPCAIMLPVKPHIYENKKNPEQTAALLSEVGNLDQPSTRADALDMVIRTVHFFPTNVYNDMYDDVVGHEWYAGTVECAYQNGMIDERMVTDRHFYPEAPVTLGDFLVFAMNGYQSRKPWPREQTSEPGGAEYLHGKGYQRAYVRAAEAVGLLTDPAADLERELTRGEVVTYCRKMSGILYG